MTSDSIEVLSRLVPTGLWSETGNLLRFNRLVVDVDSTTAFLYRRCVTDHINRLRRTQGAKFKLDLYSATLVNYVEFSRHVNQLLDFFANRKIDPILVYQGKFMEAPLFGLIAAQFKKNTQRVRDLIDLNVKLSESSCEMMEAPKDLARPNLALNVFKSIVNSRRQAGAKITIHQAFYSSYPIIAKLARDYKCPVLINNGDFIIMDVRRGFILLEEFWREYIETKDAISREANSKESARSAKSSASNASNASRNLVRFHYNSLFLRQHPGLTTRLAMTLYPITTVDFVVTYSESLQRLKVFESAYKERDFASCANKSTAKQKFKHHHAAAKRFESALRFLCGKNVELLSGFVRSEATRTNTSFDDDFKSIQDNYAVAFDFKQRLKYILKYVGDTHQVKYIEQCLIDRECTADYLLDLLCCSIGHLAGVNYNRFMQCEDINTNQSAHSLLGPGKSMLMSLFSSNKSHKSENSVSLSTKHQDTMTRYSEASLTILDRFQSKLMERNLTTTHNGAQVDAIREKLKLHNLARNSYAKQDCMKFINLVFMSEDITKLNPKSEAVINKFLGSNESDIKTQLAIVTSLHVFAIAVAAVDDKYFTSTYAGLSVQFKLAIINHYLCQNELSSESKHKELKPLVDLIKRSGFKNVTTQSKTIKSNIATQTESAKPNSKRSPSQTKKSSGSADNATAKHIRHLIEMLNASMEAYCELNSFFNYPLPKLNLQAHYNPILLFNLALHLHEHPKDHGLITL